VDKDLKSQGPRAPVTNASTGAHSDQSVDEFFTRLQSEMRRPDLSQDAIAAAFQAIQKLALDTDAEQAVGAAVPPLPAGVPGVCPVCRTANAAGSQFCAGCGVPLHVAQSDAAGRSQEVPMQRPGDHHYHHHYHHHYFPAGNGTGQATGQDFRPAAVTAAVRDVRPRPAAPGAPLSRAEVAVRKMSQDWAQACNTKHLDDLVDLYSADALVLRPNFSPVRGIAAIREFFFAALDAGLGEAEMDPIRVELFGDVAYESGRCKTLVPTATGKRREERGKYLMLFVHEPGGDWKTVADCWTSDLSLGVEPVPPLQQASPVRPQRK